ncbi:MAG: hypothetical protein AAFQ82_09620, partial [Myxococcota bacterium]
DIGSVEDQRLAIVSYLDARQKLDALNRRLSIASIGAGFAGSAAAIGASLLTNGGLIALGASVAIGVVGEVANRVLQRKMRDPRSIEHMKEFHPKAAAMFEKLDRPTVSRAHWLDREEYQVLSPAEQQAYDKAVAEILEHNKRSEAKAKIWNGVARASGYAGLILPLLFTPPGWVVTATVIGGSVGGMLMANRFTNQIVPTHTDA